jgi:hypothetical protein
VSIGCGKKAEESGNKTERREQQVVTDIEQELAKQELFCGGVGRDCPTYITKIAVLQKTKLKFCSGFLTKDNVVVTASSCLPDRLRLKDAACDKDITFFFANTDSSEKPVRVKCEKVLEVSNLDVTKEPFLWRSDVAYLKVDASDPKIKKELNARKHITPSRLGMDNTERPFYSWGVDQIDSAQPGSYQGIIRKSDECRTIKNSYFNPLSNSEYSPVITLVGCEFSDGNSGAPILDYRGKVRGIVSRPIDQKEIDEVVSMRILAGSLKPMMHVTNYACAPIYNSDDNVQNENECNQPLDINSYDAGQSAMFSEANIFKTPIQKLEVYLNGSSRYFKFNVTLNPVGEAYDLKVVVSCFKNVPKWINEFTNNKPFTTYIDIAPMRIERKMNDVGVIFADETAGDKKETKFQFKPSLLRKDKQATVFMWSDGPTTTFNSVPEACPGSLF